MSLPSRFGLYDPRFEHDACGIGFVANVRGEPSHSIVAQGVEILLNLVHRGACGCDPLTGDGAGLLIQVPDRFFRQECRKLGFSLPEAQTYGVGFVFLPKDVVARRHCEQTIEDKILASGQKLLGWRDVPVNEAALGPMARASAPYMRQVFVGCEGLELKDFERKLFVIRKRAENALRALPAKSACYFASFSSRTVTYKGLLLAEQLTGYYPDLDDERMESALAMVHQRFSTNTFPTWELAQPFRTLCHNGEINTVQGNRWMMYARERLFSAGIFGGDAHHIVPVIDPAGSDSASFDNAAEVLMHGGRDLRHVLAMMVPEAWQNDRHMPADKRAFYEYHACLTEPWDGPAALAFTDGKQIGALLDRNGLRPARWLLTKDGTIVMGSETGVLEFAPEVIERRGRLEPGRMLLVDLEAGRIVEDDELKHELAARKPYAKWLAENKLTLGELEDGDGTTQDALPLVQRQRMFGYTLEDVHMLLAPMAAKGVDPVGSMGSDTPLAVLSDEPQLLYNYFKQHFAQVTNPAIDPIREELVMSLKTFLGPEGNILDELPDQAQMIELPYPIITNVELAKLRNVNLPHHRKPAVLRMLFRVKDRGPGLKSALDELCRQASEAVTQGYSYILLSDKNATHELAPVPALLATAAVHHHLIRNGTRMKLGLVVETGEARTVHHFCLLTGYGAAAINPYVALETIADLANSGRHPELTDFQTAQQKYIKSVNKGLLKVMSKMGISTLQSYQSAQIFEAIGLSPDLIERYFTGTASRIAGIDLEVIATEAGLRHQQAFTQRTPGKPRLEPGSDLHYRAQGERHLWGPRVISALQRAARQTDFQSYQEYSTLINDQSKGLITLRGMWDLDLLPTPIDIDEVEPAAELVKRFATGAMSFGSISAEAHETLAIAMNRIGARSNTGEGGEKEERLYDQRRSSIKQVASGRFGVTTHYLVNADELQIKVAQGAKPGEGGQLPGHKVDEIIAKTRNATPGVSLISPPPHHDIYSIEDLAQLIFDLKMVNPTARISVKLVAEAGVGTVAAGVAKAHADVILISGHDGGTGASPLTSIKHAGVPWELGLAETHQVLVKNDLRSRVVLQADGQMRTGRDVVIATLLGAEEYGFATAPLVASGCILMRKCHLNTCPVGIATQDPELRSKFAGKPEHVINFFFYVAEEARQLMAQLGFRTIREMVGHAERLRPRDCREHWKASRLDFSDVLLRAEPVSGSTVCQSIAQDHGVERSLDVSLIERARPALERRERVEFDVEIRNIHRTVGGQLAGEVARRHGRKALPPGTLKLNFRGTAGQSFGAWLVDGMEFSLAGDANDYVCKGMAGGVMSIRPPDGTTYAADVSILIGNVVLYGATGGEAFFNGMAGERFCVRNSGANAVVEGVGDHGCEYMTGGRVVVIGKTGRNFAAGMSGGFAYVLDEEGQFASNCNMEMVELEALGLEDETLVRELLRKHLIHTSSSKARELLDHWSRTVRQFVKVVPVEYRRVLKERSEVGTLPLPRVAAVGA